VTVFTLTVLNLERRMPAMGVLYPVILPWLSVSATTFVAAVRARAAAAGLLTRHPETRRLPIGFTSRLDRPTMLPW